MKNCIFPKQQLTLCRLSFVDEKAAAKYGQFDALISTPRKYLWNKERGVRANTETLKALVFPLAIHGVSQCET